MNTEHLLRRIELTAPLKAAAPWDNSGVQIAGQIETTDKLAITLDPLPHIVDQALEWGAQCILTHHPLSMEPQFLNRRNSYHQVAASCLAAGAWLYSAHTSLDANPCGPAAWLPDAMNLSDRTVLEPTYSTAYTGIHFHLDDKYEQLLPSWAELPQVKDLQVPNQNEILLVCARDEWDGLKKRLMRDIEETPAFLLMDLALEPLVMGIGLTGALPGPMKWNTFTNALAEALDFPAWVEIGDVPDTVSRVACCPGSGASLAEQAAALDSDVLITGDVKYHAALETPLCILDVGHFILEERMMHQFALLLSEDKELDDVEIRFFPGSDPRRVVPPVSVD